MLLLLSWSPVSPTSMLSRKIRWSSENKSATSTKSVALSSFEKIHNRLSIIPTNVDSAWADLPVNDLDFC